MKIKTLNYNTPNNIQTRKKTEPNFEGLWTRPVRAMRNSEYVRDKIGDIVNFISVPEAKIDSLVLNESMDKLELLHCISKNFHRRNHYIPKDERDSVETVSRIFRAIKKPKNRYFYLLDELDSSLTDMCKMFELVKNDPKLARHIALFYPRVIKPLNLNENSAKFIIQILKSKHGKTILKNPAEYRSYFVLNYDKKNCIPRLNSLIDSKNTTEKLMILSMIFKNYSAS